jgi:hypothetical protein
LNEAQLELFNRGNAHYTIGEFELAKECYEKILNDGIDNYVIQHNCGLTCIKLNQLDQALKYFEAPIAAGYAESLISRGAVLRTLGHYKQAMMDFGQAFILDPKNASAYSNYGNSLREFGMPEIGANFCKIAQTYSNDPVHRLNESVCHLMKGDLIEGWKNYDARWYYESATSFKPVYHGPEWDGTQNVNGLTVLVYGEQGFGDCIQFVRYVKMLANLNATVVLLVRQPLVSLFEENFPNVIVTSKIDEVPSYHYNVPLLSLPKCFGTTIDTIPYPDQYLSTTITPHSMRFLQPTTKKRVGIQWGSNGVAFITRFRKMDLAKLLEISRDDIQLVCLNFDLTDEEKHLLQEYNVLVPTLGNFHETAKLMIQCDLIVTVDTVTAHLAGALGVPTYVMLSQYGCDWRWFTERSDSPFYSCVKLFRQTDTTWDSVITQIKQEI